MKSRLTLSVVAATALFALAGCSGSTETTSQSAASSNSSETAKTISIEDNYGTHKLKVPAQAVAATDNRSFELLEDWGVDLVAAPVKLMPSTLERYTNDKNIVNIGNHREPDLEALAATNPDLIINGQRFAKHYEDIKKLNPDATVLEFEPRKGQPLDQELKRQALALGEVFNKQDEAKKLVEDFDAALKRAKEAYNPEKTVMAVNVSGGEIGFVAPSKGRFFGAFFDLVGMKPALEIANASDDHQGDDISVEAIAEANPDWVLVLDRDAAIAKDAAPAKTVLEENAALKNVTALKEGHLVYAPNDTYTNENIITYTEVLNSMADAFENAK